MKEKIDKYLDLAKEVHLANVPFDTPEVESLLRVSGRGTAQNFVNRFINFFGRHLFMTITSIIAVILAGFYLLSPTKHSVDSSNCVNNNKVSKLANLYAQEFKPNSQKDSLSQITLQSNDYSRIVNNDTISKIIVLNSKQFNIEDIQWTQVFFNPEDWSFKWIHKKERVKIFNEFGKYQEQNLEWNEIIDEKYLIKISNLLEDSIRNIVDISYIKSFCNADLSAYYLNITELINDLKVDFKKLKMLLLYAQINKKLLNNPGEEFRIKSKGINLPKETLVKLGISFSDSSISLPVDMIIQKTDNRNKLHGDIRTSKLINIKNMPDDDIIVSLNLTYEWEKKLIESNPQSIVWLGARFNFLERERFSFFSNFFDNIILDTTKQANKPKTVNVQSYYNFIEFNSLNDYRKNCPVIIDKYLAIDNYDAILYWGNSDMRKLFEINNRIAAQDVEKNKLFESWYLDSSKYNNLVNDSINNSFVKKNLEELVKYRYLIPVDIQIPYYGFTKEELDTMPNATFVTLWYYPNDEFLSALPEDTRKQLEKEMKLVESVRKGEIQPEDACDEIKSEKSLLGLCNLTDKAITNLNIYPNPALDYINIKFDVLDTRFYKIILTDATGQYVKDLSDWTESGKNEIKVIVPTTGLQNGAYIVNVVTEKGEKLLAKFIVNH